MSAHLLTGAQLAEQAGSNVAHIMLDCVLNASTQAEALRHIDAAMNDCFNPDDDPTVRAVVAGFAAGVVSVVQSGLAAARSDGGR